MFNVSHIIASGGLLLITIIVFAESGMMLGFFLPGDTLLFTAGFFAGQGKLPLGWLMILVVLAAIAGCNTGYIIGQRAGKRLFRKPNGILFRQSYVKRAEVFYEKHGGKTILLACFVPIVRTFVPVVAGIGNMKRQKFVVYNIIGASLWGSGVVLLGDFFGKKVPNIDKYLLPAIGLAVVLSFGPMIYHLIQALIQHRKGLASTKPKE
jgi:membrane-associated protein